MLRRRILYLVSLIGCIVFYIAYREWMAWLFLLTVLLLPWFSLLISLPAMCLLRITAFPDKIAHKDEWVPLYLKMRAVLPAPPLSWKFKLTSNYEPKRTIAIVSDEFYAKHCGCYQLEVKRGRKYDYLGLFRFPFGKKIRQKIYVFPKPIVVDDIPALDRYLFGAWKPKPDGFSENHELRLYRPGDSLRHIHWKLSAKTGKFIFREPMVPIRGVLALTMNLSGSAKQIDTKLGKLLYLSRYLLEKELPHELHCRWLNEKHVFHISNEQELINVLYKLLIATPCTDDDLPDVQASWMYHIGGERDDGE